MSRRRAGRGVAAGGALAALALLAACTSSDSTTAGTASAAASTTTGGTSPIPTSTTTAPSTDAPSTSTGSTPTTSIPAPAPLIPKGACSTSQLTVRVLRGSGAQQQEFALITFTNSSQVPCTLYGYPGVSLRLNGAALAQPAGRTGATPTTVRLAPGAQGQSMLTDYSACQAALSDTVRVYPPNTTAFVDRPLQVRGCQLVVAPVTAS
ncbi:MAG: DUF4232 domain-containing protein [Actinomycetota bacterium]|nr:DUF4232 domain-containing protein [Actinomycetota bacterium]